MLAALMIGHHLSVSALWWVPAPPASLLARRNLVALVGKRCRTAGSANAFTTAALSLATISLGVPFERPDAVPERMWSGTPISSWSQRPATANQRALP